MDLVFATAFAVASSLLILAPGVPWPLEWLVGVGFLLVLPGYALVAALFPESPTHQSRLVTRTVGGPPWLVRLGLTLVLSALVVGVIGVVLGRTVGLTLGASVLAIDLVAVVGFAVAAYRRSSLRAQQRGDPSSKLGPLLGSVFSRQTTGQSVALALGLFLLVGALVFVAAAPPTAEPHSNVALLSPNENGTLTASGYPETFETGQEEPLFVNIENAEGEPLSYSVVVLAQDVDPGGDVRSQQQIERGELPLQDGERDQLQLNISPNITGDAIRVQFLVYENEVPAQPSESNADHELAIWVEVVEGESE